MRGQGGDKCDSRMKIGGESSGPIASRLAPTIDRVLPEKMRSTVGASLLAMGPVLPKLILLEPDQSTINTVSPTTCR